MAKTVTKEQLSDCLERISEHFAQTNEPFVGASASVAGGIGMVPHPSAGDNNKFLKGDGTWGNPQSGDAITLDGYSKPASASAVSSSDTVVQAVGKLEKALDGKQAAGSYLTTTGTAADSSKLGGSAAADYAKLASPVFTGTPTAPTAEAGTNTAQIATTAFVMGALSSLINQAPETLDTLKELATALGDDPNFSTTIMNLIGEKLPLSGGTITGNLTVNGTTTSTAFTGPLTGNVTGNADTATNASKVNNHTVNADVPSGAKFTDTVYTHPTTAGNKHIPSGGSSGQILRWSADGTATWGADNNTTYSNFVKSGSGAAAGLVPAPSTTAGTTKYLREDGTWSVPPDNNTVYTHPTTSGNKHVPSGGSSGQFLGWDSDGTAKWVANPNTNTDTLMTQNVSTTNSTYPVLLCPTANATANQGAKTGIFGSGVKVNPSGSEVIATKFTGALTGNVTGNCSGSSGSCTGNAATATNASKVNNHTVEADVPSGAKFTDTVYTHPTTAGNKHIPAGGSSGQILRWSADGTAVWGADNNTTYSNFVKSGSGAAAGLVPSPGTTAGTTKYLREDGTWQVPPDNNTTYTAASAAPKANGTAAVGTSAKYAREDHVHPLQTTVSGSSGSCTGNAATATTLKTARTVDGVSFNGSANITHYGSCSTAADTAEKTVDCTGFTLATGAKINVKFTVTNTVNDPTLNVNSTGAKAIYYRGAAISKGYLAANRTYAFVYNGTQYELIGDINTDTNTKVTQTKTTTDNEYSVLAMADAAATATKTNGARFSTGITMNPSTNTITATTFNGALVGNVTGNCSGSSGSCTGNAANVTGTVALANGGTGATSRLGALKALTNESVGTNAQYLLTITSSWGKGGYTSLADAKKILGVTYYGSCSTAAATAAKVVACDNFVLATGIKIAVKFTVTNTASSPTLNVNSTGAKAIYYRGAAITAGYLAANRTYEFVYNGTQYELVGDIDTNTVYTHPTTTGNKHIPSGGSSGQFLGWDSDGTAKWVNNPNTNTDTLMTQNVSTTNSTYPILLCPTANATANQGAKTGIFGSGIKANPSTSTITATLSGNASTATKVNGKTIPVVSSFNSTTGVLTLTSLS